MEDAAAVQRFVRRAVEEGLDAAAVKQYLEAQDLFKQQDVLHFSQGDSVKEIVLQAVKDAFQGAAIKKFILEAVNNELKGPGLENFIQKIVDQGLKGTAARDWVLQVVNNAIVQHMAVAPADKNIPDEEKMKQEKDVFSEHASLSRVLFAAALAFTLPYMLARLV
jgi:hypothetical protein